MKRPCSSVKVRFSVAWMRTRADGTGSPPGLSTTPWIVSFIGVFVTGGMGVTGEVQAARNIISAAPAQHRITRPAGWFRNH